MEENPSVSSIAKTLGMYIVLCMLWQYRLWIFQVRDTKVEIFLAKNQV